MPMYTFKCKCGNEQDIICDNFDKDLRVCSKCGCGMKRNPNEKPKDDKNK